MTHRRAFFFCLAMPGFLACQAVGDSPGSTGGIPYDFGDAWTTVPRI